MRKIFTLSFFTLALIAASLNSFAQTCTISTTNPNPTPAFGPTTTVSSANGFSSTNQTTLGTFPNGGTTELTSPIYFYSGSQSAIYFKYDLAAEGNPGAQVTAYQITIRYGNPVQTLTCNQTTIINLTPTPTTYYFTISGLTFPSNTNFQIKLDLTVNGAGSNRDVVASAFQVNASPATGSLPVKFSSFDGRSVNGNISLTWNVAVEENVSHYEVEKSTDNRNFNTIGSVNADGKDSYSYLDTKASSATTYYRVKAVDIDGNLTYSPIITMKGGKSSITLRGFPMPVLNNLTLQHSTATAESQISISSAEGREVQLVTPAKGSQQTTISLSSLKAGMYVVRYTNGNGEVETLKIVKQ